MPGCTGGWSGSWLADKVILCPQNHTGDKEGQRARPSGAGAALLAAGGEQAAKGVTREGKPSLCSLSVFPFLGDLGQT